MPIETLVTSALKPVVGAAAKKSFNSLFKLLSEKYKLRDFKKFEDSYIEYCQRILTVKTLESPDKVFNIDDIYVPIDLNESGRSTRLEVDDNTSLDTNKAILIKGLAGQGKSTLLRKLLSNHAKSFNRLPIFYELKNYSGGLLITEISTSLANQGINLGVETLRQIIKDSNVKVYLDAFDEVNPEHRGKLLDEIRNLINGNNCHVVCTSRPDTEIDSLSELETYKVCELTETQIFKIIKKMASDDEKASELCEALSNSHLHRKGDSVLKSPILVVLFCVSYNLGEEIPSTLSQFYSNIFDTVFHRHDNIKGKVQRERHWNDNRKIYRELFDCLCFISLQSGLHNFSKETFVDLVERSLAYVNEDKAIADKISNELSSITNLIIEDGFNDFKFVHKSIQEYFAASLVTSLEHKKKQGFYKKCFNDHSFYETFKQTLIFLEELDYYDYYEYGFIPAIFEMFNIHEDFMPEKIELPDVITNLFLNKLMKKIKINVYKSKSSENIELGIENFIFTELDNYSAMYNNLFTFASEHIKIDISDIAMKKLVLEHGNKIGEGLYLLSLKSLLKGTQQPETVAKDALNLAFDVLIKRKLDASYKKLANRRKSLNDENDFDF